jgi:hypothetical protein
MFSTRETSAVLQDVHCIPTGVNEQLLKEVPLRGVTTQRSLILFTSHIHAQWISDSSSSLSTTESVQLRLRGNVTPRRNLPFGHISRNQTYICSYTNSGLQYRVLRRGHDVSEKHSASIIRVVLHLLNYSSKLKMEVVCSSQMSDSLQTTRRHNPEDHMLRSHCPEDLKPAQKFVYLLSFELILPLTDCEVRECCKRISFQNLTVA